MNIYAGNTELAHPLQDAEQSNETWDHLKLAIASSTGFERWQGSRKVEDPSSNDRLLDELVCRYLRETLETLAY